MVHKFVNKRILPSFAAACLTMWLPFSAMSVNSVENLSKTEKSETVTNLNKSKKNVSIPETPTFKTADISKNYVVLKWKGVSCSGVKIYKYNKSEKKYKTLKTIRNSKTNSLKVTGLKSGEKYLFKIKAYNIDKNNHVTYGNASKAFGVRTIKSSTKHKLVNKNGITYVDGVLIANKTYKLPRSYNPGLKKSTVSAFSQMQRAALKEGIYLYISSGFRSYDYQAQLYNSYVYRDGKAAADRYSARPGYSEHQTGLAIDVNNPSSSFDNTPQARWLAKNCYKYGFIIRYPKGKEHITGYKYESWHVRYVGKTLAKKIYKSGKTMEEYFGITSKYKS